MVLVKVAVLLASVGSGVAEFTTAVFKASEGVAAVTVMVMVSSEAAGHRCVVTGNDSTATELQVAHPVTAETKVTWLGSVSTTTTPVAVCGPLLVAFTV